MVSRGLPGTLALLATLLASPGAAHAQLGCHATWTCAPGAATTSDRCDRGADCASNICILAPDGGTGSCLAPSEECAWCFVTSPDTCPRVSVGTRELPLAPRLDAGCEYELCGADNRYRVDLDRPRLGTGALAACFAATLDPWGDGDCDSDRIPNRLDVGDAVCIPNVPVGRVEGTDLVRCRGEFKPVPSPECTAVSPEPSLFGCSLETQTFGICCVDHLACPLLPDAGPPRCVRLPTAPGDPPAGVCTYGGGTGTDPSCLAEPPTDDCDAVGEDSGYERWARGNCNAACDGNDNEDSILVCGCPDAGFDAWEPDAFVVSEPDAWVPDMDAGVVSSMDAALGPDAPGPDTGPGSFSFSGAGCRCVVGGARHERGAALLALAGLALCASSIRARGRRRTRRPR
jgi:hypothetical protein